MSNAKPEYVTPTVTVMDEEDVLKIFQVTSAGSGWWASAQGAGKTSM